MKVSCHSGHPRALFGGNKLSYVVLYPSISGRYLISTWGRLGMRGLAGLTPRDWVTVNRPSPFHPLIHDHSEEANLAGIPHIRPKSPRSPKSFTWWSGFLDSPSQTGHPQFISSKTPSTHGLLLKVHVGHVHLVHSLASTVGMDSHSLPNPKQKGHECGDATSCGSGVQSNHHRDCPDMSDPETKLQSPVIAGFITPTNW